MKNTFGNLIIFKRHPKHAIRFARKYFKKKPIKIAEIGIFRGVNSFHILKELNVEKIYLIDPYEKYQGYEDSAGKHLVKARKQAEKRLKKFKNKTIWIRKYSDEGIKDIKEELDFIYIDGNHTYEYVLKDMNLYWNKLKKGGVLAGHDIHEYRKFPGVARALFEFCKKNNKNPIISREDWWIIK